MFCLFPLLKCRSLPRSWITPSTRSPIWWARKLSGNNCYPPTRTFSIAPAIFESTSPLWQVIQEPWSHRTSLRDVGPSDRANPLKHPIGEGEGCNPSWEGCHWCFQGKVSWRSCHQEGKNCFSYEDLWSPCQESMSMLQVMGLEQALGGHSPWALYVPSETQAGGDSYSP